MKKINLNWVFNKLGIESPYGKKALEALKPYKPEETELLRSAINELSFVVKTIDNKKDLINSLKRDFMELRNVSGSVLNLKNGQTLGETELFEIKNFAIIASDMAEVANNIGLLSSSIELTSLKNLVKLLNPDSIVTRSFHIHERWSDKLKAIREEKSKLEKQILQSIDENEKKALRLQRAEIVNEEKDEELVVRKKLSDSLRVWVEDLDLAMVNLGKFELLIGKAELAISYKASVPTIYERDNFDDILIERAVHPEIAELLQKEGKSFTPISLNVQKGVTLLTGANMGGKSVALRSIALNAALVCLGFFPFADKMAMKIPDFIEVIAGDGEDIKAGLSSFGADIKELNLLLEKLENSKGLVICDEFGRSTNPYEGSRFVRTLCEILQNSDSYGIIATHYDGIQVTGANSYRVAGLKKDFKSELVTLKELPKDLSDFMDYSLIKTENKSEVPQEALSIASLLGLPQTFIEKLKKYY